MTLKIDLHHILPQWSTTKKKNTTTNCKKKKSLKIYILCFYSLTANTSQRTISPKEKKAFMTVQYLIQGIMHLYF